MRADDVEVFSNEPAFDYKTVKVVDARSDLSPRQGGPTLDDAAHRLRALAVRLGANAIVDAKYRRVAQQNGRDVIFVRGTAALLPDDITCPSCAEVIKRKARKCRFCGEEVTIGLMPGFREAEGPKPAEGTEAHVASPPLPGWKRWHTVVAIIVGVPIALTIVAGVLGPVVDPEGWKRTQAEAKAERDREERKVQASAAAEQKAEAAAAAAKQAEADQEKQKGFHCLSGWDGSNRSTVEQVKARLREPSSFEHVETRIAPEEKGAHALIMTYRAKNGFGGTNVERALATVNHETCAAQLILTE